MPALDNPKQEAVALKYAQDVLNPEVKPSYTKSIQEVYGTSYESANKHIGQVVNSGVKNRIQEILEGKGLTDDYLLTYGRDNFLLSEDKNIGLKAWRTFLEIKGIINADQSVSIANIVFAETIVQPAPIPQDIVVSQATSDNPA